MAVARRRSYILQANCDPTDAVGDLVYISGPPVGGLYDVSKADPTNPAKMPVVASIIQKVTASLCTIQLYSVVTIYTGLVPGAVYVVGTDGRPSKFGDLNYPISGGSTQFQQIGVAASSTELILFPLDSEYGSISGGRYYQQILTATPNPLVFTAPMFFKHGGVDTECVYYNGQRILEGAGNDYTASESGGPGTGYDTIILSFTPRPSSNWRIDFCPSP